MIAAALEVANDRVDAAVRSVLWQPLTARLAELPPGELLAHVETWLARAARLSPREIFLDVPAWAHSLYTLGGATARDAALAAPEFFRRSRDGVLSPSVGA
ncbi:MAG: hypothetical protein ACREH8_14420 [Opitutaceae bacterium]